jgi:cytochrome c peroxidase
MWCGLVTAVATSGESRTESTRPPGIKAQYQRPAAIPYPGGNERTADREHLGRALFFDPRLSASGSTSCATCHHPGLSWSDGLSVARGAQMRPLERRTPTILNLAWAPALFWDGRADTLEDQALAPIQSEREMNLPLDQLIARLQGIRGYRDLFARAYPGEPLAAPAVAKAIATFERGIVSAQAPFDRWIAGEPRAISPAAERGFVLFTGKARCSTCHTGWRFTDDGFYDIGIAADDVGRGKVVPQIPLAHFAFKTPTLRNVAERAPYLHNGSASTLAEVIDLYDRGGVTHRPSLSPEIKPLALTAPEKKDLVAFLESLTSVDQEVRVPALPR